VIMGYGRVSRAARLRKNDLGCTLGLKMVRNVTDVITVVPFGEANARPAALKVGSEGGVMTAKTTTTVFRVEPQPWYERAACRGRDADCFFPEKGGSTRAAKRICQTCVVQVECLEYALANDERFGIWGGMSERERRRLKKRVC
jgi:WhiB family transcriptional regulator, redox-sensing transcriptional regulator